MNYICVNVKCGNLSFTNHSETNSKLNIKCVWKTCNGCGRNQQQEFYFEDLIFKNSKAVFIFQYLPENLKSLKTKEDYKIRCSTLIDK